MALQNLAAGTVALLCLAACSAAEPSRARLDVAASTPPRTDAGYTAPGAVGVQTAAVTLSKPVVIAPDAPKGMWQYLPPGRRGTSFNVPLEAAPTLDAAAASVRETADRCWLKKGGNYAGYVLSPIDSSAPDRRVLRISEKKAPGDVVLTLQVGETKNVRFVRVTGPLADTDLVKQIESDLMLLARRLKDGGPARCV